jgi:hypothetical protein
MAVTASRREKHKNSSPTHLQVLYPAFDIHAGKPAFSQQVNYLEEKMHNIRRHVIALAALLALTVLGSASQIWAQNLELGVHKNKIINGFEVELRGDYRESNATPTRLTAALEHINIPVGTPIAFCMQDSVTLVKTRIGVGKVKMVGGIPKAEVELRISDGDLVPRVTVGDKLQARQNAVAPFKTTPGCGIHLLVAGSFK